MLDINTKLLKKNAYRVTKHRGESALRIRVPGGSIDVKHFDILKQVAEKYGNGRIHITIRQGFEIPGIPMEQMEKVNKMITPILRDLKEEVGVKIGDEHKGYPAAGTRNVSACIGNNVCPFANYDTTSLAWEIERNIFPNDYHVKIALTGCPNDCIKAHMQDFGIIGQVEPEYDKDRCIGCEACVKNCRAKVTGALTFENFKVKRDPTRCIGCGECILKCPTSAWTRGQNYFRVVIMGRTGKKNPRLATCFLEWVDEASIIRIINNTYKFIDRHIDRSLEKEHVGYIVDRVGFNTFKEEVLQGVDLPSKTKVAKFLNFDGYRYENNTLYS